MLVLGFLSLGQGIAQLANVDELTPGQLLKFGKNAVRKGDVFTAIFFYEKYYTLRNSNPKVNYNLAELHHYKDCNEQLLQLCSPRKRSSGIEASCINRNRMFFADRLYLPQFLFC